jgi:outer membrane receptor protein involved in Fe transport
MLAPETSLFARASRGGRANAERVLFGGGIQPDGGIAHRIAVDQVDQQELGIKHATRQSSWSATLFHASTRLYDQDITSVANRFFGRLYQASGVELEASLHCGPLRVDGGLTWTAGRIARDEITPQDVGQQVNPRLMGYLAPTLHWGAATAAVNIIGVSRFPSLSGGMPNPAFVQVNAMAGYDLPHGWRAALTANNLFDRIGITEIENASAGVPANGLGTARSVTGRTLQLSISHEI